MSQLFVVVNIYRLPLSPTSECGKFSGHLFLKIWQAVRKPWTAWPFM